MSCKVNTSIKLVKLSIVIPLVILFSHEAFCVLCVPQKYTNTSNVREKYSEFQLDVEKGDFEKQQLRGLCIC